MKKSLIIILVLAVMAVGLAVALVKLPVKQAANSDQQGTAADVIRDNPDFIGFCFDKNIDQSVWVANTGKGQVLADTSCNTLYVYSKDKNNSSQCTAECAQNWPPYLFDASDPESVARASQTDISFFKRTDGTYQYSYKGQPLYYYAGDKTPGDAKGDGVGGVWSVVKYQSAGK